MEPTPSSSTHVTPGGLFLDDGGTGGLPVLFVHSAGGSTEQWPAQLSHLRRRRRAIALDLRGHGRSRPPADGDYSVPALASDIGAAADFLGIDRFVLIGHCMGGAAGVSFAGSHPERVAGLLLLDPASDGRSLPDEEKRGLMAALAGETYRAAVEAQWESLIGPSSEEVRRLVFDMLWRTPRESVVGTLGALLDFDPVTPLSRYRGPRLSVITPLNDLPTAYHVLAPGLPHRRVEGTGHWLQLDAPHEVNRQIDAFLAEVTAEARVQR